MTVVLQVRLKEAIDRDGFFDWVWATLSEEGLLGIHEGTVLTPPGELHVDCAVPDTRRDWIEQQNEIDAELYFSTQEAAQNAARSIGNQYATGCLILGIREQKEEDWDAQWKASFRGVRVSPFWHILPPWEDQSALDRTETALIIQPGSGFGTGTHETTQLCLRELALRSEQCRGHRVLDFGSGSGILSIAAVKLGGRVVGVEIDPLARDNARENAALNHVELSEKGMLSFRANLPSAEDKFNMIIANIFKPVLIENSVELISRLVADGVVILSGLLERDVADVVECYRLHGLRNHKVTTHSLGEWWAVVFES